MLADRSAISIANSETGQNRDDADYCTPVVPWLKPVAGSQQIGVRSRRLHSACSLGQGTAAIGPVAVGGLAQSLLACIPRPRLPPPRAPRGATTNRLMATFGTAVFGIPVASHSSTGARLACSRCSGQRPRR
jgi:hypothetical protein